MPEPDAIKGKKKKRAYRAAINALSADDIAPQPGDSPGQAAAIAHNNEMCGKRDFSTQERRRLAHSGAALPDGSFPITNEEDLSNAVHLAGHAKDPSAARRHISARARALGLKDPYKENVSKKATKANRGSGDQGFEVPEPADRTTSNPGLAYRHPDLRQSSTDASALFANLQTNPVGFVGSAAFHNANSGSDAPEGAPGARVRVTQLDAAGMAGSFNGMQDMNCRPEQRSNYDSARQSATKPNGSHSLSDVQSHAVSNKQMTASEKLDIIKRAMRGEL